jgi:DMSO/TMAO reductase YedYZ molybdopterin-dependent catalytic subunit
MTRVDPAVHRRGLERASRRLLLRGTLSLGALSLLSGCNLEDDDAVDRMLSAMSRWNDTVQAALFSRARMAPTYRESDITDPFPFNAYYPLSEVRHVDGGSWRIEVSGLVAERRQWTLADLDTIQQTNQITHHIIHRGLGAIGKWGGVPFRDFLAASAPMRARYVSFRCAATIAALSTWRAHCIGRRCWR